MSNFDLKKRGILSGSSALINKYRFQGGDVVLNETDGKLYRATVDGLGETSGVLTEVSASSGGVGTGNWSVAYARRRINTDSADGAEVGSGILYDREYEYALGVLVQVGSVVAITSSSLQIVVQSSKTDAVTKYIGLMGYSPDGGSNTYDIEAGLVAAFATVDSSDYMTGFRMSKTSNSEITWIQNGSNKEFATFWNDAGKFGYFVIARRKVTS